MAYRQDIRNQLPYDAIVFDNHAYDNSIIGVTTDDRVVYSFEKMVEELMEDEKITRIEAVEWIEYNTIRAIAYIDNAPVIMYELEGDE